MYTESENADGRPVLSGVEATRVNFLSPLAVLEIEIISTLAAEKLNHIQQTRTCIKTDNFLLF